MYMCRVHVGVDIGHERMVGRGVRRVLEHVVLLGHVALLNLGNLLADGDHGVAEAVELGLVLRLGGLDHDGAGDGPRHGGRVVAVILQALGDVLGADAGLVGDAMLDNSITDSPEAGEVESPDAPLDA